ncbi:MAG: HD-GYP domain-containing protein [Candidatus Omnitrophica bacterium]|nr:HD-GYP domain-containing protein [Candidatus Omnitrophota bacterium]
MDGNPQENNIDWKNIEEKFFEKVANHFRPSSPENNTNLGYQVALEEASQNMIRFKKPEHLIKSIVHMIDQEVGVTHTAVLLYKENNNSYVLIDSKGQEGIKIPVGYIRLNIGNSLISVFTDSGHSILDSSGALVYGTVKKMLEDKKVLAENSGLAERLENIKSQMELLQADICVPSHFKKKLLGVLILGRKVSGKDFMRDELGFFLTLANNAAMAISNAQLIEDLQVKVKEVEVLLNKSHRLFIHTSIALAAAIDARDPYTHGHTERVTAYALAVAEEMGDSLEINAFRNFKESLHIAALLHDIGKLGIPDNILNKKGALTPEEYEKVKEHPVIGATILYPIKELGGIVDAVRSHQEKFDGTGYPDGIKGKAIPVMARIIAIADAFDAITTNRPYRDRKTIEVAVEEISRNSGTQFDPEITEAFLAAYEKKKLFNLF